MINKKLVGLSMVMLILLSLGFAVFSDKTIVISIGKEAPAEERAPSITGFDVVVEGDSKTTRLDIIGNRSSHYNMPDNFEIKDSAGELMLANVELREDKVVLQPEKTPIKEIEFNGLDTTKEILLRLEDTPEEKEAGFEEVYSIDPTKLNFTNATVKVIATGKKLFKCVEWDFEAQECIGRWKKVQNIIPGQEYEFTLTADDPGYGENNDTVTVLDKEGYLIDAEETILTNESGILDIDITPRNHTTVGGIVVYDFNSTSSMDEIKLDDINENQTAPTDSYDDGYSIDASNLAFTNAIVEGIAEASELWKCTDFNFTTQECYGNWTLIANLTIGEEYNITIDAVDPGFWFGNKNSINKKKADIRIRDPAGQLENVTHVVKSRAKGTVKKQGYAGEIPVGYYDTEVTPGNKKVHKVSFNKLWLDSDEILVNLDDVGNNFTLPSGTQTTGYSIDTSNLNFTNATVEATADGNILWKCANWNYEEQDCYGSWEKVMSLTPGENYTFTITPGDPGYIEGELFGDLYSNRSWYMQNDSILVTGAEFTNSSDATLDIRQDGQSIAGYPIAVSINSSGEFTHIWNVSIDAVTDAYYITAVDNTNSSYNDTLKITINDHVHLPVEKQKEDPTYSAIIDLVDNSTADLIITFHHDAPTAQPVEIEGNVAYDLTTELLEADSYANLTIYNYTDQYFRIKVGNASDVWKFGLRKLKKLDNYIKDKNGNKVNSTVQFIDEWLDNEVKYNSTAEQHNTTIEEGTYEMRVFTLDKRIKQIKFNKLKFYENLTVPDVFLKLDNVVNNFTLPAGQQTDASYAVDPSELEFEDAVMTINATGNVLYKCSNWDFELEDCYGEWTKIAEIVPGQEYNITINATDPGFVEGVIEGDAYANKSWFMQEDNITIKGMYFPADDTVEIDITLEGNSITGYPKNVTSDSAGNFTDSWIVASDQTTDSYWISALSQTNSSYNDTFKLTINKKISTTTFEKPKEDDTYSAIIDNFDDSGSDLFVQFHHDALAAQPIRVHTRLSYNLSRTTADASDTINLTIYNWTDE